MNNDEKHIRLESELAATKAALAQAHKDYGCELRDPNGTIWEHAAKLQTRMENIRILLTAAKEHGTPLTPGSIAFDACLRHSTL